jgi:hypothetical protein
MRRLLALLLAALPAGAADLAPREGSGWAGFKPGTWLRIKRTVIQPGRMLTPTITRMTLAKAEAGSLTLEIKSENALDVADKDQRQVVPAAGEAGPGEKEKVEELEGEALSAAGRRFECARARSTVTGPTGKRVITTWIAKEPRLWVKRTVVAYDPAGKEASRSTLDLAALAEERAVGARKVTCLKYEERRTEGGFEWKGTAYLSRDMPGGLVWREDEVRQKDAVVFTLRAEILEFEAK